MKRFLFWLLVAAFLVGCQSNPPIREYSLARSALQAAQEADAPRYSSGYWHKAESTYKEAVRYYKKNDTELAKDYFIRARKYAERAENSAKLQRAKGIAY